jgi:catechol 2,3-dioxygenase-like lactoylglutathione lyase family enzyme
MPNTLDSSAIIQIGIIVRDIRQAAHKYAAVFGIPEPEIAPLAADEFAHTIYNGDPSSATGLGAYFKMGQIEMELIEPVGGPSTWEEFLRTHGEGIHHLAVRTEDMQASQDLLAAEGMWTIQQGAWDGGQYAYIDATNQLGMILELLHFD